MDDKFNDYIKEGKGVQEASCLAESDYIQENRQFAADHRVKCHIEDKEMRDKLKKQHVEQELNNVTVRY